MCFYPKDGWESRWVKSEWKKDENLAGEWNYTSGQWNGDANDKGKLNCYVEKPFIIIVAAFAGVYF
jgi:hypothetical protein